MYTYPQALDAMHKIVVELLRLLGHKNVHVSVIPDPVSGTASVVWERFNGKLTSVTIRMPVLPANYRMSAAEFDDYAGLILHEVGHPEFTDDATCDRARREGFFKLLNALEDVRMEKAVIDANLVANAKTVFEKLVYSLDYKMGRDEFDANASRNIGLVMAFLGRHANGYDIDASIITKKIDPAGKVAAVLKWAMPALMKCADTNACLILARRIQKALSKDKVKEPEKGKGEATEGQKGEPQKGEQGEAPEGQQTDQPSTEKGEASKGEQKDGEPKGDKQGPGAGASEEALTDADIESADVGPNHPKALTSDKNPLAQTEANIIQAIRHAQAKADKPFKKAIQASMPLTDVVAKQASTATKQRALLARALKRNEDDLYEGGLKHGRFDRRAAAKMQAGSANVFGRREMIDGYETDCVILVDGSGSMGLGNKIDKATVFALVVAQAASQVGVACSTYVFGTQGSGFASNGIVAVAEGRSKPDAAKFANMIEVYGGGTPLSPSMLAVASKQAIRARGKRKVMFVISDGMCSSGVNTLKGVATYIEQSMGVELAHMSIGAQLRGCFRNEVYVNPQDDVASVGLASLVKTLERDA